MIFASLRLPSFALASLLLLGAQAARAETAQAPNADPSARVRSFYLGNGMKAIFAPSDQARTFQIDVKVGAGFYAETEGKAGVAHLLEHYLFTDAKLGPEKTYLEAIKEKGGSANATTSSKETQYFATVPPKLADWVVHTFGQLLFDKTFENAPVEHAKGPVFLEIGRPSFMDSLSEAARHATPAFFRPPDFWETEFGIVEPFRSASSPRLDTAGLRATDLAEFYETYYHPENMIVFLSGKFDPVRMEKEIRRVFGAPKKRAGRKWEDPEPQARISPFREISPTSGTPRIEVGTKVSGLTHADEEALRVYFDFLAHRLMKELRNKKGETYSVWADLAFRKGSGKATIRFEAPVASFGSHLARVRGLIEQEARQGKLTPEMFKEAMALYRKKFALNERDSRAMMWQAFRKNELERVFYKQVPGKTDYQVFNAMTYDSFMQSLKKATDPRMSLESLTAPPVFFRFDPVALFFAAFVFWMLIWRRLFARRFEHSGVRWVRKISYPPAYLLQVLLVWASLGISALLFVAAHRLAIGYGLQPASSLAKFYLGWGLSIGVTTFICQLAFGKVAKKLIVVEDSLWVKSLGYRSQIVPLSEIQSLRLVRPLGLTPAQVFRMRFSFDYFHLLLLKKGLLIELRSGRAHYFGVTDPDRAFQELNRLLDLTAKAAQPAQKTELAA